MIPLLLAALVSTVVAAAPAPTDGCPVEDSKLKELSGLAFDDGGLWSMPDSQKKAEVYRLDPSTCAITGSRSLDMTLTDTEDLARGPDGALWVGDIGDNDTRRPNIAVVEVPTGGGAPRLYPLTYPDGPHNAEALLVDADRRPIVVTKDATGPAGIYRTDAAPRGAEPTPMTKVGEVTLPPTDTPPAAQYGKAGSRLVDGAATTDDGRVVALRSYTDAWLFPVPNGDVVAALTGRPVQVPLPGEPQGEAIAFDRSGTLYSGSETTGKDEEQGRLRAVPGAAQLALGEPSAARPDAAPAAPAGSERSGWWVVAVGVALLAVVAAALRRRPGRR